MNALFLPYDDASAIEFSRIEREIGGPFFTLIEDMSTAPDDEDFLAILRATGEQVTAWCIPGWGLSGENTYGVGDQRLPAEAFVGWLRPRNPKPRSITVPMVPEDQLPPMTQRYDEHCEDEANDRAAGREWR